MSEDGGGDREADEAQVQAAINALVGAGQGSAPLVVRLRDALVGANQGDAIVALCFLLWSSLQELEERDRPVMVTAMLRLIAGPGFQAVMHDP